MDGVTLNRRVGLGLGVIVMIGLIALGLTMPRSRATPPPVPEKPSVPAPPRRAASAPATPTPDPPDPSKADAAEAVAAAEPAKPLPTDDSSEASFTPRQHMEAVERAFAEQDAELGRWHLQRAMENPNHPLAAFALYKLSWAEYNLGDRDLAIENMERFLDWTQGTSSPIYRNLQKFAEKDLDRWYEERETDAPYSPGWP